MRNTKTEREMIRNQVPKEWLQRARAGLCPVCGKEKELFEEKRRVYCSQTCADKYASMFTRWSDVRDKIMRRDGEVCAVCGITPDKADEASELMRQERLKAAVNNNQQLVHDTRVEYLMKFDKDFQERLKNIMDDGWILEHALDWQSREMLGLRERVHVSFEVDHVVALCRGGSMWDEANLRVVCGVCHKKKTKLDVNGGGP